MKKHMVILSIAIVMSLIYACTLGSDRTTGIITVNLEIAGPYNARSSNTKSLIGDPEVLSVTVTAENSAGASLGNPATLNKGTNSWTGSMTVTVTGSELVTFRARGWSGANGTGSALYYGISEVTVTSSDTTLNVSIGTVLQNMTWTKYTDLEPDPFYYAIASSADGTTLALIGGTIAGFYKRYISTDSGANWTVYSNPDYYNDIAISADGTHIAAVTENNAQIHISTNSGTSWTSSSIEGVTGYTHIKISDNPKKLAAMGFSWSPAVGAWMPKLCTSTNSGVSWNVSDVDVRESWDSDSYVKGMTISTDGTKVAVADWMDYIYTSTDSGVSWEQHKVGQDIYFTGIAGSADGVKLAAVAGGYSIGDIYTSKDAGATWTKQTGAGSRTWCSVASSADGTKLAAAAYMDYIYTSADGGKTWTAQVDADAGIRAWTLKGITCSADGTKLAAFNEVGSDGLGNTTYSSVYTAGY